MANLSLQASYTSELIGAAPDPTFTIDERSYFSMRGLFARNVRSGGTSGRFYKASVHGRHAR